MRIENMRQHIESLCVQHEIMWDTKWVKDPNEAYSLRERDGGADEIQTPPITDEITYATALHEIGHILGCYQGSKNQMTRERWAWEWARRNALIWTPVMERDATRSLGWYAEQTRTETVKLDRPQVSKPLMPLEKKPA